MPRPHLTAGKTWYPLYRRLGGPQGQSGQMWKISSPPGFDPWTVQPVGSHYTDYATRPKHTAQQKLHDLGMPLICPELKNQLEVLK
jgi:hypothetical protein